MNRTALAALASLLCLVLLIGIIPMLSSRIRRQNERCDRLAAEIAAMECETEEILRQLPALQNQAQTLLKEMDTHIAPLEASGEWYAQRINTPYQPAGFSCHASAARTVPPLGMEIPRPIRLAAPHVYPGLVPCHVKVSLNGTIPQICNYLDEFHWLNPGAVVMELELQEKEEGGFSGHSTLAFPAIFIPEELEPIRAFASRKPTDDGE